MCALLLALLLLLVLLLLLLLLLCVCALIASDQDFGPWSTWISQRQMWM